MNRHDLEERVRTAAPGTAIVYHTGNLMVDRCSTGLLFGALVAKAKDVDQLARAALTLYEDGKVHLVQRRNGFNAFEYVAVKRPPPYKRVPFTGCYDMSPLLKKAPQQVKAAA